MSSNIEEFREKALDRINEYIEDNDIKQQDILFDYSRATVNRYLHNKATIPIDYIYLLKDKFGVSFDYLLGCTDVKTPDMTIRAICEKTGLNETSVKKIAELSETSKEVNKLEILNLLFADGFIENIVDLVIVNIEYLAWVVMFSSENIEGVLTKFADYTTSDYIKKISNDLQALTNKVLKETIDSLTVKNNELFAEYKFTDDEILNVLRLNPLIEHLKAFNIREENK